MRFCIEGNAMQVDSMKRRRMSIRIRRPWSVDRDLEIVHIGGATAALASPAVAKLQRLESFQHMLPARPAGPSRIRGVEESQTSILSVRIKIQRRV